MASLFNWGSSSSATVAVPTTPQDARESFGGESYGRASFSMTSLHCRRTHRQDAEEKAALAAAAMVREQMRS
jgi:hypothetical protein